MAFSFNWAGLTAPSVDPIKDEVDLKAMGQSLGKGLRGYRERTAAAEYADAIDRYRKGAQGNNMADAQRVKEIQAEIQRLRNENAQIDSVLGQAGAQQVETEVATRPVDTDYERQLATINRFDPSRVKDFSKDEIKDVQSFIGLSGNDVDGVWGPQSIKALQSFVGVPEKDIDGKWGNQSQGYWNKFINYETM